uniref:Uncharacterized protein n=1 Tax=Nelumbo nucifera TaxID=4432 RepID=A0A822ZG93_NELNU|nr:TPA_asm: hypothetical protein HUJ06_002382 [Nelumbo nucifera]
MICNRVDDRTPETILNNFISGLKPDIQHELAIMKPSTISSAISQAKLVEDKLATFRTPSSFRPQTIDPTATVPYPPPPWITLLPPSSPKPLCSPSLPHHRNYHLTSAI